MGLREYRRKRDFDKTPEPRGRTATKYPQLKFLVQKHDASHLHYDFRLELDGVLKSWAVPKGPDLDPANKRLAIQVEDHPLEYGDFEGTIPQGQYGGGTVLLWDQGTWEPLDDAEKGLREGRLKFVLHGEKLHGGWMLVRRGGSKAGPGERNWFLFKEKDQFAKTGKGITEQKPRSVTTGRNLDEIARQSDRVWGARGEVQHNGRKKKSFGEKTGASTKSSAKHAENGKAATSKLLASPAVRRARLPAKQEVQLATLAAQAPAGDDWLHEIKFDGYRMLCRVDKGKARFISRNGKDWSSKFPELVEAAGELAVGQAMLDGEVVAIEPDGITRFQTLQKIFQTGRTGELIYYAFDILHLDGHDVRQLPLEDRKKLLEQTVARSQVPSIRFSDHLEGTGPKVAAEACRLGLEGIVSKRRDAPYRPGRGVDWLKIKCSHSEEFVIGGFTRPGGSRSHFGALLLGYHDRQKNLVYAGRVGTGFDRKTLASLARAFRPLVQDKSPFVNLSGTTGQARGVTWLEPRLVAEIEFANWTDEGLLRQPSYQGLREDKSAAEVVRDTPISPTEVKVLAKQESRVARRSGRKSAAHAAHADRSQGAPADDEFAGVRLSHPEKVLYPEQDITKRDLANYYVRVAEWMLPHVKGRPLALLRCPEGHTKSCFFQKHPGQGASEHLRQVNVSASGPAEYNLTIVDTASLVALVQMGVLEIHAWGCLSRQLEKPDRLIFDLDPDPGVEWPEVVRAARELRLLLEELDLESFLKTTGGKGLHVVVPVVPRMDWDEAKAFCHAVADFMVRGAPDRYIATMSKAARKGKIFVDYLRNGRGATAVAAYSTRARAAHR